MSTEAQAAGHPVAQSGFNLLQRLGALLRRSQRDDQYLTSRQPVMLPLGVETDDVLRFLNLLQARCQRHMEVTVRFKPPGVRDVPVPALLLHALVDNAMCHGFASDQRHGRIEIAAGIEGGGLSVSVRDDGHGDRRRVMLGAGMLYACHFLEAVYGRHARIETTGIAGEGTTVLLAFPLTPEETTPSADAGGGC